MSNAEALIDGLRKARLNLECAREQVKKSEQSCYDAQDNLTSARKTYDEAMSKIELATSSNE